MPIRRYRALIQAAVALSAGTAMAAQAAANVAGGDEGQTMTWLLPDFAPAAIPVNGRPTDGITDRVVLYLVSQWPEVRHRFLPANAKRGWQILEQGDERACHGALLRTPEREKHAYFTLTHVVPPLQLVVRRERLDAVPRNAEGEALVPQLLAERRLRGAITAGRSYSAAIDAMLAARPVDSALATYSLVDFGGRVLQMLALDRADFSFEFDFALRYAQEREAAMRGLVALPVAGATRPLPAGVACPRNAWGLETIRHIDALLATPAAVRQLREAQERWLTPETLERYRPQMETFYRERLKPGAP